MVLPTILLASLSLLGASPAQPSVSGSVGSAHAFFEVPPLDVHIDPLAPCATGSASTPGAAHPDFVYFGGGSSTCTANTVTVTGKKFRFDWLKGRGGPAIKLTSFSATCTATDNGARASIKVSGLSGIKAPNPIPPNYTVNLPQARITLHETTAPGDGSLTVNLMHIRLFPEGFGFNNGEVIVGSVHCSP
jgi:hypothetical protein